VGICITEHISSLALITIHHNWTSDPPNENPIRAPGRPQFPHPAPSFLPSLQPTLLPWSLQSPSQILPTMSLVLPQSPFPCYPLHTSCLSVTDSGFQQPLGFYSVFYHQAIPRYPSPADYQSSRHFRSFPLFSPRSLDAAQGTPTKPLPLLQRRPRLGRSTPRSRYWRCCCSPGATMAELLCSRR